MQQTLRPHQDKAREDVREALVEGLRRVMVKAPTGFGKTVLAVDLINRALAKKKRIVFVVPAISLVDQTIAALQLNGVSDVGVIQAMHELSNWDMPVQVCSVQTLMRRTIPQADLVIIDEAHRWFDFYLRRVLSAADHRDHDAGADRRWLPVGLQGVCADLA
jgi:superfamily II DNA or RNA helicase